MFSKTYETDMNIKSTFLRTCKLEFSGIFHFLLLWAILLVSRTVISIHCCAVWYLWSHWGPLTVFCCSGRLCEVSLSPSGCELLHCENNAPCVESDGSAACQCLSGFGGPLCEKLLSVNFIDRDSYLLLSDVKNWPQTNITLQV